MGHFLRAFNDTRYVSFAAILTATTLLLFLKRKRKDKPVSKMLVIITGCDSGLGFSLALHAQDLGLTVVAACLDVNSVGAKLLQNRSVGGMHVVSLDIVDEISVEAFRRKIQNILEQEGLVLRALINNAGVMVFGEFEWQTEKLIQQQVEVNLLGTMRVTKALCPLLRKYKGRIVTVISHCSRTSLPGLSVYGATKAALEGWSDGLRIELAKFDIQVIKFIPGSFITQSNIMSRQLDHAYEMKSSLNEETLHLYGDYFSDYYRYLSALSVTRNPVKIDDQRLYKNFEEVILARHPYSCYETAPFRYTIYHFLFKVSPVHLRDKLVKRFVAMPEWRPAGQLN